MSEEFVVCEKIKAHQIRDNMVKEMRKSCITVEGQPSCALQLEVSGPTLIQKSWLYLKVDPSKSKSLGYT